MPQAVETLVDKLLADKDFYPELDSDERKSRAFAIANKQLSAALDISTLHWDSATGSISNIPTNGTITNPGNTSININWQPPVTVDATTPDFGNLFQSSDDGPTFTMVKASDGSNAMLVFHNAVLARAETNRNNDHIDEEGIRELAATISGWPIDIEHNTQKICGMFTAGREKDSALVVDGVIWADRNPDEAQAVMDGSRSLSVEARAKEAHCSKCGQVFASADLYCEHLQTRRSSGAVRKLKGLKSRGGATTRQPAGTNTRFDPSEIYFVARHEEGGDYSTADTSGSNTNEESTMNEEELKAQLKEAEQAKNDLQAKLDEATTAKTDLQTQLTEFKAKYDAAVAEMRRTRLGKAITDEEWTARKDDIVALPETVFDLMASKLTAGKPEVFNRDVVIVGDSAKTGEHRLTL